MKLLVPLDGSTAAAHAPNHPLWIIAAQRPGALLILMNVQNAETLGLSDVMRAEGPALAAQQSEKILKNVPSHASEGLLTELTPDAPLGTATRV
jgi:hypothetical protein